MSQDNPRPASPSAEAAANNARPGPCPFCKGCPCGAITSLRAQLTEALAKLAEVQGKLNYSEVGRQAAIDDRDGWKLRAKTAESRLAQSDALLRGGREAAVAIAQHHYARSRGDDRAEQQSEKWQDLANRIETHLATATTKEGKTT